MMRREILRARSDRRRGIAGILPGVGDRVKSVKANAGEGERARPTRAGAAGEVVEGNRPPANLSMEKTGSQRFCSNARSLNKFGAISRGGRGSGNSGCGGGIGSSG